MSEVGEGEGYTLENLVEGGYLESIPRDPLGESEYTGDAFVEIEEDGEERYRVTLHSEDEEYNIERAKRSELESGYFD